MSVSEFLYIVIRKKSQLRSIKFHEFATKMHNLRPFESHPREKKVTLDYIPSIYLHKSTPDASGATKDNRINYNQ